ncbi:MAG: hypothetical protein GYB65_22885 [Chloroflexi bacterium]|nr:hypothetical protein [Chloroflexota bacterium]
MTVIVRNVQTRSDRRVFITFPWQLYQGNPYWVPPLVSWQRHKLNQKRNPSWEYMEGDYFIAWRDEEPVGTIAAFINHRHNAYHNENVGFFGLFEVINDQVVANALLHTAAEYVESRGCCVLRGPANFSINDECGVLVKGFNEVPASVSPYNLPYYQQLLERAPGFDKLINLYSYRITLQDWLHSTKLEQTFRLTHRNNARRGITVRPVDPKHLRRDLNLVKAIYNVSWDNNWGFVPMTDKELDLMVREMRRYMEPRLALLAEVQGEVAGFLMAFPDLNQVLHRVAARPGKPELLSLMQLWWYKRRGAIDRIRIPVMGVRAEYRGIGVEAALFTELYQQAAQLSTETGWQYADAGWVLESNAPMQRIVEGYSGTDYRHHRFYQCQLAPADSYHNPLPELASTSQAFLDSRRRRSKIVVEKVPALRSGVRKISIARPHRLRSISIPATLRRRDRVPTHSPEEWIG